MGWALEVDDCAGQLTGPQRRLALEAARAVFERLGTDPFEAALAVWARGQVPAGCSTFEVETAARARVWAEAAGVVQEICGTGASLYLRQEHDSVPERPTTLRTVT